MGAGNWLPSNRSELLDWQGFYVDYEGIYGEQMEFDSGEIDAFIDYVTSELTARFPDLSPVNNWRTNSERIYLEEDIIKLVMGENETSAAVYFLLEDPKYTEYDVDTEEYGEKFGQYVDGLQEILVEGYPGFIYERTGAWTSAKIG